MTKKTLSLAAAAILIVLAAYATTRPEIPKKSPAMLQKAATHIAIGEVLRVYEVEEKEARWKYTRYLAELKLESLEKGDGPAPDELIYVRWFNRSYRGGTQPPSSRGHYGFAPERGDRVRVYLARNAHDGFDPENKDGGFNVLVPNGFEKLKSSGK